MQVIIPHSEMIGNCQRVLRGYWNLRPTAPQNGHLTERPQPSHAARDAVRVARV